MDIVPLTPEVVSVATHWSPVSVVALEPESSEKSSEKMAVWAVALGIQDVPMVAKKASARSTTVFLRRLVWRILLIGASSSTASFVVNQTALFDLINAAKNNMALANLVLCRTKITIHRTKGKWNTLLPTINYHGDYHGDCHTRSNQKRTGKGQTLFSLVPHPIEIGA